MNLPKLRALTNAHIRILKGYRRGGGDALHYDQLEKACQNSLCAAGMYRHLRADVSGWLHENEHQPRRIYCSTYCNFGHYVDTGAPVQHECRTIPPAALAAEIRGDYELAIQLMKGGSK